MMNLAFAGFRHSHIYGLLESAKKNQNINIVGCFEENEAARKEAEANGVVFNIDAYTDILNNPAVDAVAIADFYAKRGQMVIDALKAGKHVICDKPICTSLQELDEIEALVKETGLQVCCMLDLRYMPQIPTVQKLLAEDTIGEIVNISFTGQHCLDYGNRPGWYFETGKHGGTINDIAIHGVDLIRMLTKKNLSKINHARTWNAYASAEPQFKDCGQFTAEFDGISVMADVSYAAPKCSVMLPTYWDFCFWGKKGMLRFNYADSHLFVYTTEEKVIECDAAVPGYLDAFILETQGKATMMNTMDILASQRQVLEIQKIASNN